MCGLQWGGLRVDLASPDVVPPSPCALYPDSHLTHRVLVTLAASRKRRRVRPAGLTLTINSDDSLSQYTSSDDSDGSDTDASPSTPSPSRRSKSPATFRLPSPTRTPIAATEPVGLVPVGIGAGLPLRDRSVQELARHRLESSVLGLNSMDSFRVAGESPSP